MLDNFGICQSLVPMETWFSYSYELSLSLELCEPFRPILISWNPLLLDIIDRKRRGRTRSHGRWYITGFASGAL